MRADDAAEVAGAQVEHPVVQAQGLEEPLGPRHDVGVGGGGLLGGGVGEELHLLELVDPQQAPGVAPGRPGLAAEALGDRGEADRQVGLGQDLVAVHAR